MTKAFAKWLIGAIIVFASAFLAILDLVLYSFSREHTISWLIRGWAFDAHPLFVFLLGTFFGGLVVHFFGWKP